MVATDLASMFKSPVASCDHSQGAEPQTQTMKCAFLPRGRSSLDRHWSKPERASDNRRASCMENVDTILEGLAEIEEKVLEELRSLRRKARLQPGSAAPAGPDLPPLTRGQRIADAVAATMGSWKFIIVQSTLLVRVAIRIGARDRSAGSLDVDIVDENYPGSGSQHSMKLLEE